ncbi:glycoside hydrolase family 43 protein [Arthrobacter burdickii]|uniref:Family 43 glycosylhydrolase n=1 Tax=Arthrobacter burdickii TaxID=3035920 RepID=A0ABT8K0M9_9MICC|nr:glycoside hydrolase family 43 protein [Arthrobacter burdickii]MDN4610142.1 family 43 glycosylhydrolase [Arthrobacter burdickii]
MKHGEATLQSALHDPSEHDTEPQQESAPTANTPASPFTPIVAGFFPDPSICRVGPDYYLAASSFEYFPGVPLFHSTDLLTWQQVGNALTREEQLNVRTSPASAGICAPTLRHHDGTFYLITTNQAEMMRGHIVVTASSPEGPWSAPTHIGGTIGIDPDLVWDEQGQCFVTWTSFDPTCFGIVQAPVDLDTGAFTGPTQQLWSGTGLASPEAPHIFRRGDWWYMVIAEGGTEHGHAVSISRSRTVQGPFEGCPQNPILTHSGLDHPVQSTGHADFVELADGGWAMAYLGTRPRGSGFHVNGRESFLAGITWVDDWPVVLEEHYNVPLIDHSFTDTFDHPALAPRWVSPREPASDFTRPGETGGLVLEPASDPRAMLAVRPRDEQWTATASFDLGHDGAASLVLAIDDDHRYTVSADSGTIRVTATIGPLAAEVASASTSGVTSLYIQTHEAPRAHPGAPSGPDLVALGYIDHGAPLELARLDGRYLSSEVAGGFTGRVIGIRADRSAVHLTSFEYRTDTTRPQ